MIVLRDFLANLPLISIYVLYCVKEVCILISDKKSFCAVPRAQLDKRYQNVPRCPPDRDLSSEQRYPPFKQNRAKFLSVKPNSAVFFSLKPNCLQ